MPATFQSLHGDTPNIIISGLTASGKTTHAHITAGQFAFRYLSASQLLLYRIKKNPLQSPDFWILGNNSALWRLPESNLVNNDLARAERENKALVFDSLAMPWLHKKRACCIWLESSFESRINKAIISHRTQKRLTETQIRKRVAEKDSFARQELLEKFGIDIFEDRTPFDFVIDISSFIGGSTWKDAINSINEVQGIITATVGWYLTSESKYAQKFQTYSKRFKSIFLIYPEKILTD